MTDDGEAATATATEHAGVDAWLAVYLKGVAMGTADAVPGVSGGTIALIVGIYDRLVGAVASLDPRPPLAALRAERPRAALGDALVAMDVPFLLVLGTGVVTGVAAVSRVLEFALDELELLTFAFFFGLIAASAVVLYREVSLDTPGRKVVAVVGFLLAFLLVGEFRTGLGHAAPVVFAAGVVSVSAMILPGVSGSFILLALGQLEYLSNRFNDFLDAVGGLAAGGGVDPLLAPGTVVVTFVAGAFVGVLSVARLVERALERNRPATLTFLVSLMVGALRLPAREVSAAAGEPAAYGPAVVAALAGAAVVGLLEYYTESVGFQ